MAITKKDIEKLSEIFATKKDLEAFATKKDLNLLREEMNAKFDQVDRKFDQITANLDWLMGKVQKILDELVVIAHHYREHELRLEDHEKKSEFSR